jgi:tetratricopeptide (TPR) repeat protein
VNDAPMRPLSPTSSRLLLISLASLLFAGSAAPQEPSPALRQADAAYREGLAALNQNDLQTAQSKFEDVVRLAPSLEQGHSALGAVLVREGRLEAGIREALALKPGDGAAELNLALAYSQAGAQTKAAPLFERAEAAANAQKHPLPASVIEEYARVVGSEEARLRAGLRPRPKPCMQLSRTRLSRRLNESRTQEKESIRSDLPAQTGHRAPTPAVASNHSCASA